MPANPKVLKRHAVAQSRLFRIEQLELRFSNGVERTYERLASSGYGAVAVVAVTSEQEVVLVQEYGAGIDAYQWGLPKGSIDPGEDCIQAANRELMEEAGCGARELCFVKNIHISPAYMERSLDVVVATGLYEASLPGDEPEPLATMKWPLERLDELLTRRDVTDAISIAALFMVREYLSREPGRKCDQEDEIQNREQEEEN